MPRQKKRNAVSKLANDLTISICPPAPIIEGEDEKAYDELLAQVSGTVQPKDAIEEIWVRDFVDMTWEIFRYRGYKAGLIKARVSEVLEEVLELVIETSITKDATEGEKLDRQFRNNWETTPAKKLMMGWIVNDPKAIQDIHQVLKFAGMSMQDINARAMGQALFEILQIDSVLDRLERSRNALIREIEHRRAAFAEALRQATKDLDGEVQEVETEAPAL